MNNVFQIIQTKEIILQDTLVFILGQQRNNQTILIYDSNGLLFREYLLLDFKISKAIADPNLRFLLMLTELENNETILYQAFLEKSFTPISSIRIRSIKIQQIEWCNSNICALAFQKEIFLYNIFSQQILKQLDVQNCQMVQFKINSNFDTLLFQYQDNLGSAQTCSVMHLDDFSKKMKFTNCVSCLAQIENEEHLLIIATRNSVLTLIKMKFNSELSNKQEIQQNEISNLKITQSIQMKYGKQKLYLLDSSTNLYLFSLNNDYKMIKIKEIENVINFSVSIQNEYYFYINKDNILYQEYIQNQQFNIQQLDQAELSLASQGKKLAMQGILSQQEDISLSIKQYASNYDKITPQFRSIVDLFNQFKNLPLIDFRVLILPQQQKKEFKDYIPQMHDYIETQSVKHHINKIEIALKGENPLLCEGDAASGKTSVIQYVAYKKNQPLLIMNLNSFTQISDLIGKIEILPGFKLEFQPGPFALAVQQGFWILLDEANLASDSILRVIEDVLELGYLTIFGTQINPHPDLIDGTLTIRKHQNFKLFLTQNPATDEKFAKSRNLFSPSLMSQFILITFPPMNENDMKSIINQLISKKFKNIQLPIQSQFSSLVIDLYQEIKKNKLDDGLFTLRDILQLVDTVSLDSNYQNIFGIDILPMQQCLKLIITQFLQQLDNNKIINKVLDNFQTIGYSNKQFEDSQQERLRQLINWSLQQPELYLSFHNFLFPFLTLCYRTKRAALIVGQQYCGKLSSVLLWLKYSKINNFEVYQLSQSTTYEDLFGKYQPVKEDFQFIEGPITRCFGEGKVLILLNIEAPESALTESLNGILEKNFHQLLVFNKKYSRHKNFAIIGISSNAQDIKDKFTPALKSRFLTVNQEFKVIKQDIALLFQITKIQSNEDEIAKELDLEKEGISFNKIIRFIKPITEFRSFLTQYLKFTENNAQKRINNCIQFFIALSKQDNRTLYNEKIQLPLEYKDLQSEEQKSNFVFTQSRKKVADIIAIAVAAKIPLILQGSAGVGKTKIIKQFQKECAFFKNTKFYYINMNQNTDLNDLMGHYISSCEKDKKEFEFQKGQLFLAMENGGIALLDEVNLSEISILNFLASITKYPKTFIDPVSNQIIQVHEKFRIFFAQNPPYYINRNELPLTLTSKVVILVIPNYTLKEILEIFQGESQYILQGIQYFLTKIIHYPEDGDEKLLKFNNTQFTLRQFIKFRNRLEKTKFQTKQKNWEKLLKLHQMILYPLNQQEQDNLNSEIIYQKTENIFDFKIKNKDSEIRIPLLATNGFSETLLQEIQNLSDKQRLVLSKLAFCFHCKENALIEGETTSKTYLSQLFSQMIQFQNPTPFQLIYISNVTEITDLIGNTESHNVHSYKKHCQNLINKLGMGMDDKDIKNSLQVIGKKWQVDNYINQIIKNLNNQFPFVERGLTFNARFGGVICLKNITLADQSVLEGLNSLLEIEPYFVVNGKKIDLHQEFFVIGLLNDTFGGQLSDALQSRLTRIEIDVTDFLDCNNKLSESYTKFIQQKIKSIKEQNEIINYIQQILIVLKSHNLEYYNSLTSTKFYSWMNYLDLNLSATSLEKLALGVQYIVLDEKKENFNQYFTTQSLQVLYNKAQIILQKELGNKGIQNSKNIITNPTTNKIIERIFCAFSVSYIPCLIGPPGVGKSAIAQQIAQILGKEFQRVCCSDSLSVEDLFGSYAPVYEAEQSGFIFQEGYLAKALKKQSLILFDEINLASPEVLSTLQALFRKDETTLQIKDQLINKNGCVFLCSMNPPTYQGRQELPQCISNLLSTVYLEQFSIDEVLNIFRKCYQEKILNLKQDGIDFEPILELHKELSQIRQSSNYDFNIRFLQNLLQLFNKKFVQQRKQIKDEKLKKELIILCLDIIYVEHFYQTDLDLADKILQKILSKFQITENEWQNRKVLLEQKANLIYINKQTEKQDRWEQYLKFPLRSQFTPQMTNNAYAINLQNSKIFEKILIALQSKKVILCQGDHSTGKTTSIIKMASLLNQRFILLPIHCDLEADDLLGNFAIVSENYEEIQQELKNIVESINQVKQEKAKKQSMNMQYIEGVLKICLQFGYWLILDNINLARPEIVERLNSLGEDQPCLFLNEFGEENQKIIPHKNFRLICIQNPLRVESYDLSPAFYNRCLKINFRFQTQENYSDMIDILTKRGEEGLAKKLQDQVIFMEKHCNCRINLRQIKQAFTMIQENGYKNYNSVMELVFGQKYTECQKLNEFPIVDSTQQIDGEQILKKLESSSFDLQNENKKSISEWQNLSTFLKKYLNQTEIINNQYFFDQIAEKIKINENKQNDGIYELSSEKRINYSLCGLDFLFEPKILQFQELKSFKMSIRIKLLKQDFMAEIKFNSKKFFIQFEKKVDDDISIGMIIEQMVEKQYQEMYKFFKSMFESAVYECKIYLEQTSQFNFNFKLDEFSLSSLPILQLKCIQGSFHTNKKNLVDFSFDFELVICNINIGKINNLQSLRGEIELQTEKIINVFKDYGCFYLLQNLNLHPLQNEHSNLDLIEGKIEIKLGSNSPIQILNWPFHIKFEKIYACLKLKDDISLNGSIIGSFQWFQKDICGLKLSIDNNNQQMFKLELDSEKPPLDAYTILEQFFNNYFETNIFVKELSKINKMIIKKLDIITNAKCWNFQMQIQLDFKFQIFGIINFEIKTLELYCHVDSQKREFSIISTIEFFSFILEIGMAIDFEQKAESLKMIFRKSQHSPTFQEIIASYSSEINCILEKIPGYKELKINNKIKELNVENSSDFFDINNFKQLGEKIVQDFKEQAVNVQQTFEKKINDQIEEKKALIREKARAIIANVKESYIEWKNNQIMFQFEFPLSVEWKICSFLTLFDCNLLLNNIENQINVELNGNVKFMDILLPKFSLIFSKNKPIIMTINHQTLAQEFDPIQFGLSLFDQKFEEINIFPKINKIEKFLFNFQTQDFDSNFSITSQSCLNNFNFIACQNLQIIIRIQHELKKPNMGADIFAQLQVKVIFFELNIDLKLDFSELAKNQNSNSTIKLQLQSEPIENFSFNEFIQNILSYTISKEIAEFKIESIICSISFEKKTDIWVCSSILDIKNGQCSFFQNLISICNLNGQLIYCIQKGWIGSRIKGDCVINQVNLGQFDISIIKKERKEDNCIQAKLIPNENFSLVKLLSELTGEEIKLSIFFFDKSHFSNLNMEFEIVESQMLFRVKYKRDQLQFENFRFLQLENINAKIDFLSNKNGTISKELLIDFNVKLFNYSKQAKITGFPLKIENIQLTINENIYKLFDYEIFKEFKITKFKLFEQIKLKVDLNVTFNSDLSFEDLTIIGKFKNEKVEEFIFIKKISLKYQYQQKSIQLCGEIVLFCTFIFDFSYNIQSKKLLFKPKSQIKFGELIRRFDKNFDGEQDISILKSEIKKETVVEIDFSQETFFLEQNFDENLFQFYVNKKKIFILISFMIRELKFEAISSYLKRLDDYFALQKAECLFIYSKSNEIDDRDLCQFENNSQIETFLTNNKENQIEIKGISVAAQIEFKLKSQLKAFLFFADQIQLQFYFHFFKGKIKIKSKKYQFNSEKGIRCSLQFSASYDIQQINFNLSLNLDLTKTFQDFGVLNLEGELSSNLSQINGHLKLNYQHAFGFKNWTLEGQCKVNNTSIEGQINAKIQDYQARLILNIDKFFVPRGFGLLVRNIDFNTILQFFGLSLPEGFQNYIPTIEKLGMIYGQLSEEAQNQIMPEIAEKLKEQGLLPNFLDNILSVYLKQFYFVIESSTKKKQFKFNFTLFKDVKKLFFFCKGGLKVEVGKYFLLNVQVEVELIENFSVQGKGQIIFLDQSEQIGFVFKPLSIEFQVELQLLEYYFDLELKLENFMSMSGLLGFNCNKNSQKLQSKYTFFKFINVEKIIIKLEINEEIKATLEYSIEILNFKKFENSLVISFNINLIKQMIKKTFDLFLKFFDLLPENIKNLIEEINNNSKMILDFCQKLLNTDVSKELEEIKKQFEDLNEPSSTINNEPSSTIKNQPSSTTKNDPQSTKTSKNGPSSGSKREPLSKRSKSSKRQPSSKTSKREPSSKTSKREPSSKTSETSKREPSLKNSKTSKREPSLKNSKTSKREPSLKTSKKSKREPSSKTSKITKREPSSNSSKKELSSKTQGEQNQGLQYSSQFQQEIKELQLPSLQNEQSLTQKKLHKIQEDLQKQELSAKELSQDIKNNYQQFSREFSSNQQKQTTLEQKSKNFQQSDQENYQKLQELKKELETLKQEDQLNSERLQQIQQKCNFQIEKQSNSKQSQELECNFKELEQEQIQKQQLDKLQEYCRNTKKEFDRYNEELKKTKEEQRELLEVQQNQKKQFSILQKEYVDCSQDSDIISIQQVFSKDFQSFKVSQQQIHQITQKIQSIEQKQNENINILLAFSDKLEQYQLNARNLQIQHQIFIQIQNENHKNLIELNKFSQELLQFQIINFQIQNLYNLKVIILQKKKSNMKQNNNNNAKQDQISQNIDNIPQDTNISEDDLQLYTVEQEIFEEWKKSQEKSVLPFSGRIIINDQITSLNQLLKLGHLFLKLQLLHQTFEVILSGQNLPIILKTKDQPITINLLDRIYHGLQGKCNTNFQHIELKDNSINDFIILFTEKKLEFSNQCKEELLKEGNQKIFIINHEKIINLEVQSGEMKEIPSNIFELLYEITQRKQQNSGNIKLDTQEINHSKDKPQINLKESNNLKLQLEISKYTKYSLSSKGTAIDIKGIIKFFCTNGTAKDIMKKKNKGGKSLYIFLIVLDLSQFSIDSLNNILLPFLYQLIELCKECKIVCNLLIYHNPIISVKSTFSLVWSDQEYELLIDKIRDAFSDQQIEYNVEILDSIQKKYFEKFSHYKKYLLFINHQFYNYPYQRNLNFINQTYQKQIKLVSIGTGITKLANHLNLIEGILHFQLTKPDDVYSIMKDLLSKKYQKQLYNNQQFIFKIDSKRYPKELQMEKFCSDSQQPNYYLNKFFNFVIKHEQQENNSNEKVLVQQQVNLRRDNGFLNYFISVILLQLKLKVYIQKKRQQILEEQ